MKTDERTAREQVEAVIQLARAGQEPPNFSFFEFLTLVQRAIDEEYANGIRAAINAWEPYEYEEEDDT